MRIDLATEGKRLQPYSGFDKIRSKHEKIYLIMSPPRCSSTAFSRVFWEQPSVGYYSHEPFEVVYYNHDSLTHVVDKLATPLDLQNIKTIHTYDHGNSLVIKEMPYQVNSHFPLLHDQVSNGLPTGLRHGTHSR